MSMIRCCIVQLSLGLACVIAALSVMVPNIHHSTSHVIHYWEQATYRRISQCGMCVCVYICVSMCVPVCVCVCGYSIEG